LIASRLGVHEGYVTSREPIHGDDCHRKARMYINCGLQQSFLGYLSSFSIIAFLYRKISCMGNKCRAVDMAFMTMTDPLALELS
jgi:hypothetical protein